MPMTELAARAGRRSIMMLQLRFTLDGAAASKFVFGFGRHYCRLCLPFCDKHAARVSNRGPANTGTDIHWRRSEVIPLHRAAPRRMACNPYPLPDHRLHALHGAAITLCNAFQHMRVPEFVALQIR